MFLRVTAVFHALCSFSLEWFAILNPTTHLKFDGLVWKAKLNH